jgi:hypothetical protein
MPSFGHAAVFRDAEPEVLVRADTGAFASEL